MHVFTVSLPVERKVPVRAWQVCRHRFLVQGSLCACQIQHHRQQGLWLLDFEGKGDVWVQNFPELLSRKRKSLEEIVERF